MLDLFYLYRWTIPAGACFALLLSILGIHLSARGKSLQSFCVTQGAMVGVLLGTGLHIWPTLTALSVATLSFYGSDWLSKKATADKSTVFGAFFIGLLTLSYFISILFPALEMHMASVFFGDVATLSITISKRLLPLGLVLLALLLYYRRPLLNQSFEIALFGEEASKQMSHKKWTPFFLSVSLIILSLSVQWLGFLFTISFLYLPTVILGFTQRQGLKRHLILSGVVSVFSVVIGFGLSLLLPHLPTVPSIVMILILLCGFELL